MTTLQLEKTPAAFRRQARKARNGVLILTEKGKPAFALVGVDDAFALEALSLSRSSKLMRYLDGIRARSKRSRTYSLSEIRRDLKTRKRVGRHARSTRRALRRGSTKKA